MPTIHRLLFTAYLLLSMLSPTFANDGDFGTEMQAGPTITDRPFENDPSADVYARIHERTLDVASSAYLPRIGARQSYTNLVIRSNDFANAAWNKQDVTVVANILQNPWDGTMTVSRVMETAVNTNHILKSAVFFRPAGTYTGAIVMRSGLGRDWVMVQMASGSQFSINVTTGEIGPVLAAVVSSKLLDDGSRLILFTFTLSANFEEVDINFLSDPVTGSYLGDVVKGFYCSQVQLVAASTPGPLIITAATTRTVTVPDLDVDDMFAFQVAESKPVASDGEVYSFVRSYARIPADQVKPGSILFSRPAMHDVKSGTNYAVCFEEDQKLSWIFTSRKTISSIGTPDVPSSSEVNAAAALPSATVSGVTTGAVAFSFNATDSAASIQATIFAVLGTCSVVRSDSTISIDGPSVVANLQTISVSGAGIAISTSGTTIDIRYNGTGTTTVTGTNPAALRNVAATGHGGVVGDRVALWAGDKLYAVGTVITVPDANNFKVELDVIPGKDLVVTHCGFSTDAAMCVVNAAKMCDTRHTTRFYLPAYTEGITTDADIPKQTPQIDPISWLAAIIAGTTWPVYQVGEVGQYKGTILQQETITLQLSDALDTVTP